LKLEGHSVERIYLRQRSSDGTHEQHCVATGMDLSVSGPGAQGLNWASMFM